jgi:hypothetical protein
MNYLNETSIGLEALKELYKSDEEKDKGSSKSSLLSDTLKKSGAFTGLRASTNAHTNAGIYGGTSKNNSSDPNFAGLTTDKNYSKDKDKVKSEYIADSELTFKYLNENCQSSLSRTLFESISYLKLIEEDKSLNGSNYSVNFRRTVKSAKTPGNSSGTHKVIDKSLTPPKPETVARKIQITNKERLTTIGRLYRRIMKLFELNSKNSKNSKNKEG